MRSHNVNINSNHSLSLNKLKICLFFLILFSSVLFGQSNKCSATLNVEKGRNVRSTPIDGTYYSMILTNNLPVANTYILKSENSNVNCENPDKSESINNIELKINFLDENLKPIREILIQAGQKTKFLVHITVPLKANPNKWACTKIIASSINCSDYEVSTLLKTLIMSSNEE